MTKRKRLEVEEETPIINGKIAKISEPTSRIHIQIVTGSYERALHGITATIPIGALELNDSNKDEATVSFTDSFLFNAHTSAIKCLAISPPPPPTANSQKLILATGSTDEKINLFHLSTRPPKGPILPSLSSKTQQNPDNRSLGTLHTHDSSITALHFPNRSKLLSSCGNNIIAITSTRNFNTLSLIKTPNPKHPNRPIGDTSTPSTLPCGVNDFAVHPSMKLMISVGRAERCMRLWNLVTGRKAGVLNFDKEMLRAVGESTNRWGTGEGRRILWNAQGEEYAVAFQKGVCIFNLDCKPKARVVPSPSTTIHQVRYISDLERTVLAVSTEDGRILFYSTNEHETEPQSTNGNRSEKSEHHIPSCKLIGQLGGQEAGISGRIKDFQGLSLQTENPEAPQTALLITTAGSDGTIGVWTVGRQELSKGPQESLEEPINSTANGVEKASVGNQVGRLLGTYQTSSRITCLTSFVLSGTPLDDSDTPNERSDDGSVSEHSDEDGVEESDESDDSE